MSGAAAQAGLAAGRAEAAMAPIMEGMPAGLRRIAGQAAQLLTSHVRSSPQSAIISCIATLDCSIPTDERLVLRVSIGSSCLTASALDEPLADVSCCLGQGVSFVTIGSPCMLYPTPFLTSGITGFDRRAVFQLRVTKSCSCAVSKCSLG